MKNSDRSGRSAKYIVAIMAVVAGAVSATPAGAAPGDCFLRVDNVPGESADARHRGGDRSRELVARHGEPPDSDDRRGGERSGRPDFQPLKVTQRLDRAIPLLVQHAVTGRHIASVVLTPAAVPAGRRPTTSR